MSGDLVVRPAALEDVDSIVAVAASSAFASQWQRDRYCQMMLAPGDAAVRHILLVAEIAGSLVGFAAASALVAVIPPEAELENLAVLTTAQGQGVGGRLLLAVLDWAASLGAGPVRLEVRSANAAAVRLYRRHGFVQTGLRRAYYGAPVDDAVCMERAAP